MNQRPVETIWVDTSLVPPERQFAEWAAHGVASRYRPVRDAGFFAQGAFWSLGPAVVTRATVDPFIAVRDAAGIAERPLGHVQIVALLAGTVRMDTDAGTHICAAPDLFACDYARTYRIETERTQIVSVYLARDFLEQAAGPVAAHGPLRRSAESAFLAATLVAMGDVLPFVSADSAHFYARMLRDLVAAAIFDGDGGSGGKGDLRLRRRIEDAIAAGPPGQLDIAALCRSERTSRTTLYRLFRASGGVLAWDRRRRLHAVFRAMTDPAERRPIGVIGMEHGFLDSAGLSRGFRSCFGMTPGQARRLALAGSIEGEDARSAFQRLRRNVAALSP